jgi:hypothetical protein
MRLQDTNCAAAIAAAQPASSSGLPGGKHDRPECRVLHGVNRVQRGLIDAGDRISDRLTDAATEQSFGPQIVMTGHGHQSTQAVKLLATPVLNTLSNSYKALRRRAVVAAKSATV